MGKRANSEGSIYKRKSDGRWVGSLTLPSGKRKVIYGTTQREVMTRFTELRGDDLPEAPARLTLGAFLKDWLAKVEPTTRPQTYRGYESKLRVHVLPALGKVSLAKLSVQQLEAFFANIYAQGLSSRTVHHVRAILRTALNDAVKWNLIRRNPAALSEGPRVEARDPAVLTKGEAKAILEALSEDRYGALYIVALTTGLRQGEVLGLRRSDVDLERGAIRVAQTLHYVRGQWKFLTPKTKKSQRVVALPGVAVGALRNYLAEHPRIGDALLFTTSKGAPLQGGWVTRHLQDVLASAGLPRRTFHELRHGYASIMLSVGVPMRVVMELLGHTQIATTANIYTQVDPELGEEAARRLEEVLR